MTPNKDRAEAVVLAILGFAPAGMGRTKLYKAFWLAHLYFARANPGFLTDWPVVRMPNGPGIDRGDHLLGDLEAHGLISQDFEQIGPFSEKRVRLVGSPPVLSPEAGSAIREAAEFVQGHTAADLSQMSHDFSRSWRTKSNGDELDIYSDLIPDDEFTTLSNTLATVDADALFR
jgi:hypothetical protein